MTKIEIIKYTIVKVRELFQNYPVPAHGIEHVARVATWARLIASREKANVFLAEMSGWLHDIGRTKEKERLGASSFHQEMSYEMCREWFKNDPILKLLSKKEKEIILYAVRYHWNNSADKYPEAVILRDADKLDLFGEVGIKRAEEYWENDEEKMEKAFRLVFSDLSFIMTKTAQKIARDRKLVEPVKKFYFTLLKKRILKIKL